jgi:hypothetical protein
MRFAFRVSGSAVERSPINGGGPRSVERSYHVVGCSSASARDTASQLYRAELAEEGLRPAGDVTVTPSPDSTATSGT